MVMNDRSRLTAVEPDILKMTKELIGTKWIPFYPLDIEKDKYHFLLREFYEFVSEEFGIKRINDKSGISNSRFIQVEGNRVRIIDKSDANSAITEMINKSELLSHKLNDIFEQWRKKRTEDSLMFLENFTGEFLEDSKGTAYAIFKNGIVSVQKKQAGTEISFSPVYPENKFIWESSIIKAEATGEREIKPVKEFIDDLNNITLEGLEDALINSEIFQFIRLVSGLPRFFTEEESEDKEALKQLENFRDRFKAVCSSIGFLIHSYKGDSGNKAIIFVDEVIPEGHAREGRSGKSLIAKFPLHWYGNDGRFVIIDGANRRKDDKFGFSSVCKETKIILLNDVPPNYELNEVFNAITKDGVKIEPKRVNSFTKTDLKVVITSNQVIRGEGSSFRDRQHEIELSNFFSDKWKPVDEFEHEFFNADWEPDQWNLFNWFMIYCLAIYLNEGLTGYKPINLKKRKLLDDPLFWKDAVSFNTDKEALLEIYEKEFQRRIQSPKSLEIIPRSEITSLLCESLELEEDKMKTDFKKSFTTFMNYKGLRYISQGRREKGRCYILQSNLREILPDYNDSDNSNPTPSDSKNSPVKGDENLLGF
jgi:hypothetical protein